MKDYNIEQERWDAIRLERDRWKRRQIKNALNPLKVAGTIIGFWDNDGFVFFDDKRKAEPKCR